MGRHDKEKRKEYLKRRKANIKLAANNNHHSSDNHQTSQDNHSQSTINTTESSLLPTSSLASTSSDDYGVKCLIGNNFISVPHTCSSAMQNQGSDPPVFGGVNQGMMDAPLFQAQGDGGGRRGGGRGGGRGGRNNRRGGRNQSGGGGGGGGPNEDEEPPVPGSAEAVVNRKVQKVAAGEEKGSFSFTVSSAMQRRLVRKTSKCTCKELVI
ncbi:uncharacterized protein [Amphiura filiformis]|uniref:uncharacterized protein n=1 Tax=Amphiura filiformis TaxID=82378 RepID=UPI003B210657